MLLQLLRSRILSMPLVDIRRISAPPVFCSKTRRTYADLLRGYHPPGLTKFGPCKVVNVETYLSLAPGVHQPRLVHFQLQAKNYYCKRKPILKYCRTIYAIKITRKEGRVTSPLKTHQFNYFSCITCCSKVLLI